MTRRSAARRGRSARRARPPRGRAPAARRAAPAPRQLGRRERVGVVGRIAEQPDLVAVAPTPSDRGRSVLEHADGADHRRRQDRPVRRLVVEADVAGDDRQAERRHASAMPSIARSSCHAPRSVSGEPKFRQSVMPIGVAPEQATLSAPSMTADAPARYGSSAPSRAGPGPVDRERQRARPCPSSAAARRRRARPDERVRAVHVVVAPPDRLAVAGVRRCRAARAGPCARQLRRQRLEVDRLRLARRRRRSRSAARRRPGRGRRPRRRPRPPARQRISVPSVISPMAAASSS